MDNKNNRISFGNYIDSYEKEIQSSIGFVGQGHDFFVKVKADLIVDIAAANFEQSCDINILDIGCGIGLIDHHLAPFFKNIHGVDIEDSVVEKARTFNPGVRYFHYDGTSLPFNDKSMDMAFAINVMHHVQPSGWEGFTNEMFRVLRPGGMAVVFEHNPLNPLTRKAVSKCAFDRDAVLLSRRITEKLFSQSGFKGIDGSYILFFPFKSIFFRKVEKKISWLPFGAQFFINGRKQG